MLCENKFCIYWSEDRCILDEIELDIQGSCSSCIYVDLSETMLQEQRQSQRTERS